jgi:hypothetical protein
VVYLHVGAPKTGTTAIQHVLWHNRTPLARLGVLYPLARPREHFFASLDARDEPPGPAGAPWAGAWREVVGRIRAGDAPASVFSGEFLGPASSQRIEYMIESLRPADVHVIITARDLARQLTSDWQEQIKLRRDIALDRYIAHVQAADGDDEEPPRFAEMFWRQHDPVALAGAWQRFVPAENIHVVTVPPLGGGRRPTLFERFLGVIGVSLDDVCLDFDIDTNHSLGAVETEFLRRANAALRRRLGADYAPVVREVLAERALRGRAGQRPIAIPPESAGWVRRRSERMASELADAPFDVVGEVADLRSLLTDLADGEPAPHALPPSAMTPVAYDALGELLAEIIDLRAHTENLRQQVRESGGTPVERPNPPRRASHSHDDGAPIAGARAQPSDPLAGLR